MKSAYRSWLIIGALVFSWSVLANAPATLAGKLLADSGIHVQSYTGTLWRGRANGVALRIGGEPVFLEQLDWDTHFFSLALFSPAADIQGHGPGIRVNGEVVLKGERHWKLEDADIRFPAEMVSSTPLGSFAGPVTVRLVELEVDGQKVKSLEGRALWESGRWLYDNRWWPLGNFAAGLSAKSGNLYAALADQGGAIGLKGGVTVSLAGKYGFSGDIVPRQSFPNGLKAALALVGESNPDNSYRVAFQGEFPVK